MTRRSLFAMLLGLGAIPAAVARRPGRWFVEGIRYSSNVINIRDLQIDPPLLLREEGALRLFDLPPGRYDFNLQPRSIPWFEL